MFVLSLLKIAAAKHFERQLTDSYDDDPFSFLYRQMPRAYSALELTTTTDPTTLESTTSPRITTTVHAQTTRTATTSPPELVVNAETYGFIPRYNASSMEVNESDLVYGHAPAELVVNPETYVPRYNASSMELTESDLVYGHKDIPKSPETVVGQGRAPTSSPTVPLRNLPYSVKTTVNAAVKTANKTFGGVNELVRYAKNRRSAIRSGQQSAMYHGNVSNNDSYPNFVFGSIRKPVNSNFGNFFRTMTKGLKVIPNGKKLLNKVIKNRK